MTKLNDFTLQRQFKAKSENQEKYLRAITENDIVLCTGPPGSGKSASAVAYGIQHLVNNDFDRLIITRPTIGTDEFGDDKGIGFLPGSLHEKMDPFVKPIMDELETYFDRRGNHVKRLIDQKRIEILPLYFARGLTFHNSFVICDEAQNCTHNQLKMIVTRLGKSSKLVINGDIRQHDRKRKRPALEIWVKEIVNDINGIAVCELDERDIVRHHLISKLLVEIENYETWRDSNEENSFRRSNYDVFSGNGVKT